MDVNGFMHLVYEARKNENPEADERALNVIFTVSIGAMQESFKNHNSWS
jgi:hypothetical protein